MPEPTHVPYDKLLRRSKGMPSIESNGGHNKALTPSQERACFLYIDRYEELGHPCKAETYQNWCKILRLPIRIPILCFNVLDHSIH